jgi:hypothetical protein
MIEQLRRLFNTATLREKVSYQTLERVLSYLLNKEIVFKGKIDLTQADVRGISGGSSSWGDIKDKPSTFPPSPHLHPEKQDTLVSGVNIKTVNTQSLLGSGDITISGGVTSVNTQTGVVVLDADDISDSETTNKFVTATDVTNLSNLSGVNSGDQDLSGLLSNSHLTDFAHADIAHTNRAALDLVSGTNTGDQDLSGFVPYTGATTNVALGANTLSTTSGVITPKIYPVSDSTTAFQINKADGTTNVLNVDTTNSRVGIGTDIPSTSLDVYGTTAAHNINTNVGLNFKKVDNPPQTINFLTFSYPAGTELGIGTYYYRISYYNALGETSLSQYCTAITTAGNQRVQISNIPTSSDPTVIGRKIYRGIVGWGSVYGYLLATIPDNVTTTYLDTNADIVPGFILNYNIASYPNTTNQLITIDNVRALDVDANKTTLGIDAGKNTKVSNTCIGAYSGRDLTIGVENTLVGKYSGVKLTTGGQNAVLGNGLQGGTSASYNAAIGPNVLSTLVTGAGNIAIGYYNGSQIASGSSYNTLLGSHVAIAQALGNYNTGLGAFINFPTANGSNQLNIVNNIYGESVNNSSANGKISLFSSKPINSFNVSPLQYSVGTASQSGTTITGIGTTFTSSMIGSQFIFNSGQNAGLITAVASDISITVSISQTVSSGGYKIFYTGLQVTSSGNVGINTTLPTAKLHVVGTLLNQKLVEANTAVSGSPNIITSSESGSVFTNEGATALNYHTLPTAASGLTYTFYVQDADGIRVTANTGDTIRIDTSVSASAGYAESTTVGSSVTLTAINATEWVATSVIGTWTLT